MVAVKALDELKLSRNNLIGITMPGFGTNDRTYYNALKLIVGFKAQLREISIKNSVLKHFEDIGHNPEIHNSTFENAQARERAQILLDIANSENAIVVGTGDLSENALGWFTFAGDQIAHFNVNDSIPKTVVREIINRQMALSPFESEADLLSDIVLTPISPELLPSENGDFSQKTESIIGPYELHDFFIYYFVKYGFSPKKLYNYATHAFFGVYDEKEVLDTMKIFFKRFFSNQFKRSSNPDGANFGEVSLASCDVDFPSDLDLEGIMKEIDNITKKDTPQRSQMRMF
jgi:NAD+ synthase (glutamine-hydrolysing)